MCDTCGCGEKEEKVEEKEGCCTEQPEECCEEAEKPPCCDKPCEE